MFFQNRTHTASYFVSSKPDENQIIASHGSKSQSLKYRELIESDFYRFGILDSILKIDNSVTTIFTEKEILQKKRELFGERNSPVWEYTTINEVVDFLKDTEYKLVYQEQFLLLCNRILGIDYETTEFYRQGYLRKKREALIGFENLIHRKYPEKGEKLLQYFHRVMPYCL